MSTRTAVAVQRLLDAGASLVGKTNLPPYGGGIDDLGPLHGELAWGVAGVLERALAGYVAP